MFVEGVMEIMTCLWFLWIEKVKEKSPAWNLGAENIYQYSCIGCSEKSKVGPLLSPARQLGCIGAGAGTVWILGPCRSWDRVDPGTVSILGPCGSRDRVDPGTQPQLARAAFANPQAGSGLQTDTVSALSLQV